MNDIFAGYTIKEFNINDVYLPQYTLNKKTIIALRKYLKMKKRNEQNTITDDILNTGKKDEKDTYKVKVNFDIALDAAHFKIYSDFFNLVKQNLNLRKKYQIKDMLFTQSGEFIDDVYLHDRIGTTEIIFKYNQLIMMYTFSLLKSRDEIEYRLHVCSNSACDEESEDIYKKIFYMAIENSNLKGNYFKFFDEGMRWEILKLEQRSMDDIYLPDSLMEDIKLFINIYKKTGKMLRYLFSGNPGTCKTESTLVIANELKKLGVTIIKMNPIEYLEFKLKLGEVLAPALIIFDDIDLSLGSRQKGGFGRALKNFLDVLDGTEKLKDNIGIIATTNSIDLLDLAAQRPGRFDRILSFDELTKDNIRKIILKTIKYNFKDNKGIEIFTDEEVVDIFFKNAVTGAHIYNTIKSLKLRIDINEIILTKDWFIKEIIADINVIHRIKKVTRDRLGKETKALGFSFDTTEESEEYDTIEAPEINTSRF